MFSWLVEIDDFLSREIGIYELRQTALNSHVTIFGNQRQKRIVCYTTPLLYYKKLQFLSSLNIHCPMTLDRIMGNHFHAKLVHKPLQPITNKQFSPYTTILLTSTSKSHDILTTSWPGLNMTLLFCCIIPLILGMDMMKTAKIRCYY